MSTTTNCTNWMNWSIYILFDYSNCSQLKCNEWKTIHANQCSLFVRSFVRLTKFVCRMVRAPIFLSTLIVKIVQWQRKRNGKVNLCAGCAGCWCCCCWCFWLLPLLSLLLLTLAAILYIHLAPFTFAYARRISQSENANGYIKCKAIVSVWHGAVECSMASRPPVPSCNKIKIKERREKKKQGNMYSRRRNAEFSLKFFVRQWHRLRRLKRTVENLVKYLNARILACMEEFEAKPVSPSVATATVEHVRIIKRIAFA